MTLKNNGTKTISEFLKWLGENTTIIRIDDKDLITENDTMCYIDRFNKAHLMGFQNEPHVQVDLTDLKKSWDNIWQSFGNSWDKKMQNFRFLYDAFQLFYYSFEQLDYNKKLSINCRDDVDKKQYLNMLTGIHLYGMYSHGKTCVDLLDRLKLSISDVDKKFSKKFAETRNKFIEHNHNPKGFASFQLESSMWSTISTNSLLKIYIHDIDNKSERIKHVDIDYYQDYFDLEMVMTDAIKSFSSTITPKVQKGTRPDWSAKLMYLS